MKKLIEQIEAFNEEDWANHIGPADKAIPSSKEPQTTATLISWAANKIGSPILVIGGEVHMWNGKFYASSPEIFNQVVRPALMRLGLFVSQANSPDFLRGVEKSLGYLSGLAPWDMNHNPRGLNFEDGVLMMNRETMEFTEGHQPDKVFTYCLPFNYKGERKKSKVWRPFIEQIMPEQDMRRYTLASFANSLACDPMSAQRMLLLMGVGASGKSTLIDAVAEVVGNNNVCRVDDLKNLTKDESRFRIDLANHILCVCGDASGNIGNKDVLKQIISKEEIGGRRLFKEVEYFVPRASLIVASNEIGFTHALGDSGISRRIDIIQFENPVAEKDRDPLIGRKLARPEEQREMIMDMLDCYIEMQNTYGKMVRPAALDLALRDLMQDGDAFLSFMSWCGLEPASRQGDGPEFEWLFQDAILDAYNRFCGKYNSSTIHMRTLKGKCRMHSCASRGRRGGAHDFRFTVVDNDMFEKNFNFISNEL